MMSSHTGEWKNVKDNPRGHRVRRVTRKGVEYQQWNDRYGKLVRVQSAVEDESDSSSESEGEETPEISEPRSNPQDDGAKKNRHAKDVYEKAARDVPETDPTASEHFELSSRARSRSRPAILGPRDAANPNSESDAFDAPGTSRHMQQPEKANSYPVAVTAQRPENVLRRSATTPAAFVSELLGKSYSFAEIRTGNFSACRDFILQHPEIVDVENTPFLLEAARALQAGLVEHPESCIEKAVFISECSELSGSGLREYLAELTREPRTRAYQDFLETCSKTFNEVKRRADAQTAALISSAAGAQAAAHASRPGHLTRAGPHFAPSALAPAWTHRPSFSGPPDLSYATTNLSITNRKVTEDRTGPKRHTIDTQPSLFQPTGQSHVDQLGLPPQDLSTLLEQSDLRGHRSIASATDYDFKGTDGEEEKLDPAYKKRSDARQFFSEGRVFAMLWHENVGMSEKQPSKEVKFVTTKGRYGERIFSHIRRMVVVRQRGGYCWCIGINSYGNLGMMKKGLKPEDIKAHSVIHPDNLKPWTHPKEPQMAKQPIAVTMAPNQDLNKMSRLNFGRPHTVEWNVKVMNVGKVTDSTMPYLRSYWRNEMGLD